MTRNRLVMLVAVAMLMMAVSAYAGSKPTGIYDSPDGNDPIGVRALDMRTTCSGTDDPDIFPSYAYHTPRWLCIHADVGLVNPALHKANYCVNAGDMTIFSLLNCLNCCNELYNDGQGVTTRSEYLNQRDACVRRAMGVRIAEERSPYACYDDRS